MPPKCKFQEGERVLCFHGPLIYEAKCLKHRVQGKDKQISYLIHYAGWNKNWDEWVPEDRVLKFNDTNVLEQQKLQKTLNNQQTQNKTKKSNQSGKAQGRRSEGAKEKESDSRASTPIAPIEKPAGRSGKNASGSVTPSSSIESSEIPRKKRSRYEPSAETEEYKVKASIKIAMSDELKLILLDDKEAVTSEKKLHVLPAQFNVDKVLSDYVRSKSETLNSPTSESLREITNGVREYFNSTLGLQFLYNWEKPQFEDFTKNSTNTPPSQSYGAYHLLRLFVNLGNLLSYTPLDNYSIALLVNHFKDLLEYLERNSSKLFDSERDYYDPPGDYSKRIA